MVVGGVAGSAARALARLETALAGVRMVQAGGGPHPPQADRHAAAMSCPPARLQDPEQPEENEDRDRYPGKPQEPGAHIALHPLHRWNAREASGFTVIRDVVGLRWPLSDAGGVFGRAFSVRARCRR